MREVHLKEAPVPVPGRRRLAGQAEHPSAPGWLMSCSCVTCSNTCLGHFRITACDLSHTMAYAAVERIAGLADVGSFDVLSSYRLFEWVVYRPSER